MKLPLACLVAIVAIGFVSAGPGAVISIITDILDLVLSVGNVVSGGCIYYQDICTYQTSIEAIEAELTPKFKILDDLDMANGDLYKDMTDILALNNDLSQQTGNLQFLVISITRKLGNSAQTYDQLAKEYEERTSNLITTYKADVEAIKKSAITKTIVLGVLDGAKVLYQGLKYTYNKLKSDGKLKRPTSFKTEAVKAKPISLALESVTSPRYYRAKQQYQRAKTWWDKPNNKKIRGYMKEAGVIVGSLFSLGVSVTVDVLMAKKMRDGLRTTEAELLEIKGSIDGYITAEREVNNDLKGAYSESRQSFSDLTKLIENAITLNGVSSSSILTIQDAKTLKAKQSIVINEYARIQEQLQAIDLNAEVILTIKTGVDFDDGLRRISITIDRQGFGPVTNDQILSVIAKEYPSRSSYDGQSLQRFRG